MKTHKIKAVSYFFQKCWENSKTFIVKKDDNFQEGDIMYLQEFDHNNRVYTGRELKCTILFVSHENSGIKDGYVVFSFCIEEYILPQDTKE